MTAAFFVTGTDTDVGKTYVSCALLQALWASGFSTTALKPAGSGCTVSEGVLQCEDAALLLAASSHPLPPEIACPYRYQPAIAPGVAAEQCGETIDFRRLRGLVTQQPVDVTLVEGAGGLLCPMGGGRTIADLILALELPALIVASAGLGTINHTLLTIESAQQRGIPIIGIYLNHNHHGFDKGLARSNALEIERHSGVPVLEIITREQTELSARTFLHHFPMQNRANRSSSIPS